jgi:glycosyltransferase involved in cell wall biosynthesis
MTDLYNIDGWIDRSPKTLVKGLSVERSLSALLPVKNVQSSLAATVSRILEVLPELTESFELLIIDDGSTDATIEVADELEIRYPQVRVVRHGDHQGRSAALKDGIEQSQGDVLFIADDDCRLPMAKVAKLWKAIDTHQVVLGRAVETDESNSTARESVPKGRQGGFQMLCREATKPLAASLADQAELKDKLAELGQSWLEVDVSVYTPFNKADLEQSRPGRPNYLASPKTAPVQ